MLRFCKTVALEWYEKAIADGPENNLHVYMRACSLRNHLMYEIGKGDEVVAWQKEKCECYPNNPLEWIFLIEAHIMDNNYKEAYTLFQRAIELFPENWRLYMLGGDICEAQKNTMKHLCIGIKLAK